MAAADTAGSNPGVPAEKHFPFAIVAGHGLFAATTVVLVLLTPSVSAPVRSWRMRG